MGLNRTLILLQYGKVFNLHRKLFQSYFGAKECRDLVPIQVQRAHLLVRKLLAKPRDYINSLERYDRYRWRCLQPYSHLIQLFYFPYPPNSLRIRNQRGLQGRSSRWSHQHPGGHR